MKVRPINDGIRATKVKAKKTSGQPSSLSGMHGRPTPYNSTVVSDSYRVLSLCVEFLQPYKPRPETVASVVRNMVAGALGLQSNVSREVRDEERRKLKDAKGRVADDK